LHGGYAHKEAGAPHLEGEILDNGPEFTSRHFDAWAYMRGIEIDYIQG
jgi:transposase InsO family protein